MSNTSANHLCIAGPACRDAAVTADGDRLGAITEAPDTLCDACNRQITSCTQQLVKDWHNLRAALGERATSTSQPVRSTPAPAVPMSTAKAALMSAIVDVADRAATIVAEALNIEPPDGRRKPPPPIRHDGKVHTLEDGSAAQQAYDMSHPDDLRRLTVAVALIEPHIDELATAPAQPFTIWGPEGEDDQKPLVRDPETGDPIRARGRIFVEYTGLDVALDIVDLHNKARAELGKTRLRHKFAMPCPRCGGRIGRDDGTAIVDCENCKASWTEREYKFLAGLVVDEGRQTDILKWLLAEAYWRLDTLKTGAQAIRESPALESPASGGYVLQGIDLVLNGHKSAEERKIVSDKTAARERQTDEDTWTWKNETTYRPPRRKPKPAPYQDIRRLTQSSRSTLVEDVTYLPDSFDRTKVCPTCNLIHPDGQCAS